MAYLETPLKLKDIDWNSMTAERVDEEFCYAVKATIEISDEFFQTNFPNPNLASIVLIFLPLKLYKYKYL